MKYERPVRKIEYDGDHKNNSLIIGNFGDVEFTAKGVFDLSGMIYTKKTVEFTVIGQGLIRFHGSCAKIIIHLVKGNCTIDFSELTSKEVTCVSLRDTSRIMLGPTRVINRANLQDEAVLTYSGKPRIESYSISGRSKIEFADKAFA